MNLLEDLVGRGHDPEWARAYVGEIHRAEKRFAPLTLALARRLEVMPTVDQTGGMVMCLRVQLPNGTYAYFSELGEFDEPAFGVYREDPHDPEADVQELGWHEMCGTEPAAGDWCDNPALCERVAEWAAPLIAGYLQWA